MLTKTALETKQCFQMIIQVEYKFTDH